MKKILLAEDEKALSEVLRSEFEINHFDIILAKDGEEALKKMRSSMPDLLILDLIMPKKDGFQVMEEMQADDVLRTIPILVLSNLGQDEDIKRALSLGAADYFVKTQHPLKEIVEKVNQLFTQGPLVR